MTAITKHRNFFNWTKLLYVKPCEYEEEMQITIVELKALNKLYRRGDRHAKKAKAQMIEANLRLVISFQSYGRECGWCVLGRRLSE
jgi:DNA-directed RNA polymerase sigma subunit (sigma70/sigma32)